MLRKIIFTGLLMMSLSAAGEIEKEAQETVNAFKQNIKNKEMQTQAKKSVDKFYQKMLPYVEQWKKRIYYDEKTGKMIIKGDVDVKTPPDIKVGVGENKFLFASDRIYIFVSSSVPKETLIQYAKSIDELGLNNRAVMIIRGCIEGCKYIRPTLKWISSILHENGKNKNGIPVQFWIDPLMFRMYKINKVPCVAFTEDVKLAVIGLSEGLKYNLKTTPKTVVSCGDWSLEYHLKQLYKKTGNPKLKAILAEVKKKSYVEKR